VCKLDKSGLKYAWQWHDENLSHPNKSQVDTQNKKILACKGEKIIFQIVTKVILDLSIEH
jgi:hypothetical protein